MSDEKVRFTGESTSLVQAADRGTKAIQRQEQSLRGAAKAGKTLGSELAQTFTGMAKGAIITGLIAKSLQSAAEASERIRKAGAAASEARGKEAVEIERALMPSGMDAQQRQSILGLVGEGTTKAEDTSGFIQAFAKKKGERITYADTLRATQAFISGAYSQEELLDARTLPTMQEQQAKIAGMSDEARTELEARRRKRGQEAETRAAAETNPYARFVDEEIARRQLANPILQTGVEMVKSAPIAGEFVGEIEAARIERQMRERDTPKRRTGPFGLQSWEDQRLDYEDAKRREGMPIRLAPDQIDRIAPTPRPITGTQGNRE